MVRFLRSTCKDFETREELELFLLTEKVFAGIHVPISILLAVGVLSGAGVIPYASSYEWHLLLVASIALVVSNGRDANHSVRDFFLAKHRSENGTTSSANGKLQGSIGGQMHMVSAMIMTLGSLSLLNSSIIGLLQPGLNPSEVCRRQYAFGFGLHLVGAAGNNLAMDSNLRHVHSTRVLLSFQHVIGSAALFVSGLLMLPSLDYGKGNIFQKSAVVFSTSVGGILTVLSAVMQYFHTLAFLWAQQDLFERREYNLQLELKTKLHAIQETDVDNRGYLGRLRDVFKFKGKSLIWSQADQKRGDCDAEDDLSKTGSESDLLIDGLSCHYDVDAASVTSARTISSASSWSGDEGGGRWGNTQNVRS